VRRAAIRGGLLAGTGLICAATGAIAAGAPPVGPSTVPRCQTSALTGKVLTPFDGAAGTFGTVIVLTSKATHRCVVSGRPKVLLFGASGRQLHAAQTSTPGAVHTVIVGHGGTAGASLIWHGSPDEPGSVASQCEQVRKIWVTPTGAAGHVTIIGTALGGGLQICDPPGAFRVGPLTPPPFSF
jgi:hypothetical protein